MFMRRNVSATIHAYNQPVTVIGTSFGGERGDFFEQDAQLLPLEARVDWSSLVHLGSTTSEDYLNQIQKYLADSAAINTAADVSA